MIRHWMLSNFKAAREASLEFAPLTIFTGTNSAGKSTIIQSILMTAQTLQSPHPEIAVLLNGPFVKLGEFQDVYSHIIRRREDSEEAEASSNFNFITVNFRLATSPHLEQTVADYFHTQRFITRGTRYERLITRPPAVAVECTYTFSFDQDERLHKELRLYPLLESSLVRPMYKSQLDTISRSAPIVDPFADSSEDIVDPFAFADADPFADVSEHIDPPVFEEVDGLYTHENSYLEVLRVDREDNLKRLPSDFPKNKLGPSEQSALNYDLAPDFSIDSERFGAILSHFLPKGYYFYWEQVERDAHEFFWNFPPWAWCPVEFAPQRSTQTKPFKAEIAEAISRLFANTRLFANDELHLILIEIFDEMMRDVVLGRLVRLGYSAEYVQKDAVQRPTSETIAQMSEIGKAVDRLRTLFNFDNLHDLVVLLFKLKADTLFRKVWSNHKEAIIETVMKGRSADYHYEKRSLDTQEQEDSVSFVEEFFSTKIKYLGPLRDDPKPLYPLSEISDPQDVGLRGQFTAFVYHWHSDRTISYIPSIDFVDAQEQATSSATTLGLAVSDWLQYLGVVDEIKATDRGRIGFEMQVAPDDNGFFYDLTQVGVGVSQVLPILVMCLLAPPGTTLILEQPELHLHPRVQTRLADFFASMIRLGKQCVIETHSEHLINRLRYCIAMSESESLADDVLLYFAEMEDGEAKYRPIRINKYGVIEDWPSGFFDESHNLSLDILRAGTAKRKREKERQDG